MSQLHQDNPKNPKSLLASGEDVSTPTTHLALTLTPRSSTAFFHALLGSFYTLDLLDWGQLEQMWGVIDFSFLHSN